jgi:hypothetical protein
MSCRVHSRRKLGGGRVTARVNIIVICAATTTAIAGRRRRSSSSISSRRSRHRRSSRPHRSCRGGYCHRGCRCCRAIRTNPQKKKKRAPRDCGTKEHSNWLNRWYTTERLVNLFALTLALTLARVHSSTALLGSGFCEMVVVVVAAAAVVVAAVVVVVVMAAVVVVVAAASVVVVGKQSDGQCQQRVRFLLARSPEWRRTPQFRSLHARS